MSKYLYNGVELPALPEWDTEAYPYAMIRQVVGSEQPWFYVTSEPITHRLNLALGKLALSITGYGGCFRLVDGTWEQFDEMGIQLGRYFTDEDTAFLWSNHDILNSDGTLYLAASTPVPVSGIDNKALVQGWFVGKRLAAQRGRA